MPKQTCDSKGGCKKSVSPSVCWKMKSRDSVLIVIKIWWTTASCWSGERPFGRVLQRGCQRLLKTSTGTIDRVKSLCLVQECGESGKVSVLRIPVSNLH